MAKIDSWTGEEFDGPAYFFTTDHGTEVVSRASFFKNLGFDDPMGIVDPNKSEAEQETEEPEGDSE